jgi:hypothetical protein
VSDADALAPIAGKLKPLIRMLSSSHHGEIVAAAHAIVRTLKSGGTDIHALADSIGNGKLSESEMRRLYDAGYAAGVQAAENENGGRMFRSVNLDDEPSWHERAELARDRLRVCRPPRPAA